MRSFGDAILHCANYGWIGMANDIDAVTAMHIDVFSTVDIPYVCTEAVTDPYRNRSGTRPTGTHAARQRSLRAIP